MKLECSGTTDILVSWNDCVEIDDELVWVITVSLLAVLVVEKNGIEFWVVSKVVANADVVIDKCTDEDVGIDINFTFTDGMLLATVDVPDLIMLVDDKLIGKFETAVVIDDNFDDVIMLVVWAALLDKIVSDEAEIAFNVLVAVPLLTMDFDTLFPIDIVDDVLIFAVNAFIVFWVRFWDVELIVGNVVEVNVVFETNMFKTVVSKDVANLIGVNDNDAALVDVAAVMLLAILGLPFERNVKLAYWVEYDVIFVETFCRRLMDVLILE